MAENRNKYLKIHPNIDRNRYISPTTSYLPVTDYFDPKVYRALTPPLTSFAFKSGRKSPSYEEADMDTLARSAQARAEFIRISRQNQMANSPMNTIPRRRLDSPPQIRITSHTDRNREQNEHYCESDSDPEETLDRLERERILRYRRRLEVNKEPEITPELKSAIRGASAQEICDALLAESEKNLRKSRLEEQEFVSRCMNTQKAKRGSSLERIKARRSPIAMNAHDLHVDLMEERLKSHMNRAISPIARPMSPFRLPKITSSVHPITKRYEFYANSQCMPRARPLQSDNLPRRYEYTPLYPIPKFNYSAARTSPSVGFPRQHDHIAINSTSRHTGPGTQEYSYRHVRY